MSVGWQRVFDFSDYGALLALVRNSVIAGAVLGCSCGLVSAFVMMRDLPFAVHGISELSFAGAAGALLLGVERGARARSSARWSRRCCIGLLGVRARDRNSVIGVVMPFGLGLGVLFLALYQGRTANKFGRSPARSSRSTRAQLTTWSGRRWSSSSRWSLCGGR